MSDKTLVERLQEIVYEHAGYGGSHDGKYERDDCIELAREIDKLESANAELVKAREECERQYQEWVRKCTETESANAELEAKIERLESRGIEDLHHENAELEVKYRDLIYQVGRKHPHETRHETAKRYIIEAESSGDDGCNAASDVMAALDG